MENYTIRKLKDGFSISEGGGFGPIEIRPSNREAYKARGLSLEGLARAMFDLYSVLPAPDHRKTAELDNRN